MAALLRAFFGYLFLVLIVRLVARRPGKQITTFDFVLIFFMGGLALTAIVGDDFSLTNAAGLIIGIGMAHFFIATLRARSSLLARMFDGTPLVLMDNHQWRVETLRKMRVADDDVIASARDHGHKTLPALDVVVLERNGEITVCQIPKGSGT